MDGQNALVSSRSYVAVGQETAWGTYATCTTNLDFISCSVKTTKDSKILEQVSLGRGYAKRIGLGKTVVGDLEYYYRPTDTACNYLLRNAFGGTATASIPDGYTAGSGYLHTFKPAFGSATHTSISLNVRKGPATDGKVFEYTGGKINEMVFTAELDDAVKCKASFIFKDSTNTSNDIVTALTVSSGNVLSFVDGRFSVNETSFASLTSSVYWHVQSIEIGINNNLKSDNEVRRIGSDIINALPTGQGTFTLKCKMRFDTITAYNLMISGAKLYGEAEFIGATLASGVVEGIKFQWPALYIKSASDPELGIDDVLTSEVEFDVCRDDSSAAGFAIQALVTNLVTAY